MNKELDAERLFDCFEELAHSNNIGVAVQVIDLDDEMKIVYTLPILDDVEFYEFKVDVNGSIESILNDFKKEIHEIYQKEMSYQDKESVEASLTELDQWISKSLERGE